MLSRDSVTVTVDAVIYYRVSNPTMVCQYDCSCHMSYVPIWLLSQSPSLIKNVKQGNKQCRGLQPLNPPLGGDNSQVNEGSSANRGFEVSWFSEMCLGQSAWLRSSPKGTKVVFLCFRSIACRDSLSFLLPWEMSRHLKVFLSKGADRPLDGDNTGRGNRSVGCESWTRWDVSDLPLITLNILSTMDVIVRQHFQRKLLLLAKFNHALAKLDGIENQNQTVLWMLKEVRMSDNVCSRNCTFWSRWPSLRYIKDILIRKKSAKSAIIPLITFTITSKDVRLPVQLQRAMAAEAEAAREARAKVMMVMLVVKTLVIIVMILVL